MTCDLTRSTVAGSRSSYRSAAAYAASLSANGRVSAARAFRAKPYTPSAAIPATMLRREIFLLSIASDMARVPIAMAAIVARFFGKRATVYPLSARPI